VSTTRTTRLFPVSGDCGIFGFPQSLDQNVEIETVRAGLQPLQLDEVAGQAAQAALTNDVTLREGWYDTPPTKGLRGVGRVYAGWGLSQPFYLQELWRDIGYGALADFLVGFWEGFFLPKDANNLLAML